jgi:hypothetical protein
MSFRNFFCAAISFCSFFLFSETIFADTLYLKNKDVFSGKLLTYQNKICVFKTNHDAVLKIDTADIEKIFTDSPYEITFSNEEKVIGKLEEGKNKEVVLKSGFGESVIDINSVAKMVRYFKKNTDSTTESLSNESFGEEVKKQPPLEFLTGSTILLSPGQYQMDFGFDYRQNRDYYPLPMDGYFENHSYSARMLRFDTALRAGLFEGVEGWIALPFSYTYIEQVSSNAYVRDREEWNIADVAAGVQFQLVNETSQIPAISFSLTVSSPTGKKRYYDSENDWKDPLNNGSGHWMVSPGLSFVRTLDPAIIFGGINYDYSFKENIDGYKIEPGWGFSTYYGIGFALNDSLSLGTRFSYSYSSNMNADDVEVHGSDKDAMDISFSASYRFSENWIATPQITYSLNSDAGASILSLRLNRLFN